MRQIKIKRLEGKIVVKTGLHIGAGNDIIEIGGMDNPVIKNPFTKEPYIPGSSIKGKMRALLEWKENKLDAFRGDPCRCGLPNCPICRIFGCSNTDKQSAIKRGPSRLIIRDAVLDEKFSKECSDKGKPILEDKKENTLNRITAHAVPRPIERVVPGAIFNFELIYRILDIDDEGKPGDGKTDEGYFTTVVLAGLRLLQNDYLGGGGSRGNGRIEFIDLKDENGAAVSL